MTHTPRREILAAAGVAAAVLLGATACFDNVGPSFFNLQDATIASRPAAPTEQATPGFSPIGLSPQRDGFVYVPAGYAPGTPAPLLVLLHGAGQSSAIWQDEDVQALADEFGIVLLAPDSRTFSWDIIDTGFFGADVKFIDAALARVFARCSIDPARVALAGFSDGASYALSLGLVNGDFVTRIGAFSPGFVWAPQRRGKPPVYVTHGNQDPVLPVTNTRNEIVPGLQSGGYSVEFVEFAGGHELPAAVARPAFAWLSGAAPEG